MHRIQGRPHIYQSSQSEMLVTTLDDSARTVGCLNRRRNTMLNTHLKLAAAALLASVAFVGSAHAQVVGESSNTAKVKIDESRSAEHTSKLKSLMRTSYAVFCLKKKKHLEPTKQPGTLTMIIQMNHTHVQTHDSHKSPYICR